MNKFAGILLTSRTQMHIAHLQVQSYAAHMALNAYYDGIVGLIDGLVEEYQGKYGIVKGYKIIGIKDMDTPEAILTYLKSILKFVEVARKQLPQDTNIQNNIDAIVTLLDSTIYKLTFLK